MKPFLAALSFFIITTTHVIYAQKFIDKVKFFNDTSVVNATLTLNIKKVLAKKDKVGYIFPATFSCRMGDSLDVNDHISLEVRGHFRRGYCYLPPLKLIYKNNAANQLYHLKSLKLVSACAVTPTDEQNLLKEYLIYKIYNLITDKSFNVRLLNLHYQDSSGNKKTINQHAFLIEDIKELAKRNKSVEWTAKKTPTALANRTQMTIVAIFEYMIGNTDWSVPTLHNVRLIRTKSDSTSRPYVIPYDFDFSGLVNTNYSAPDERLGIESVRERMYRGLSCTEDDLAAALDIFNKQKVNIYAAINNFSLLTPRTKREMTDYLDEFFKTINYPKEAKKIFIEDAAH